MKIKDADVRVQKGAFNDLPMEELAQFLNQHFLMLCIDTDGALLITRKNGAPKETLTVTNNVEDHNVR